MITIILVTAFSSTALGMRIPRNLQTEDPNTLMDGLYSLLNEEQFRLVGDHLEYINSDASSDLFKLAGLIPKLAKVNSRLPKDVRNYILKIFEKDGYPVVWGDNAAGLEHVRRFRKSMEAWITHPPSHYTSRQSRSSHAVVPPRPNGPECGCDTKHLRSCAQQFKALRWLLNKLCEKIEQSNDRQLHRSVTDEVQKLTHEIENNSHPSRGDIENQAKRRLQNLLGRHWARNARQVNRVRDRSGSCYSMQSARSAASMHPSAPASPPAAAGPRTPPRRFQPNRFQSNTSFQLNQNQNRMPGFKHSAHSAFRRVQPGEFRRYRTQHPSFQRERHGYRRTADELS